MGFSQPATLTVPANGTIEVTAFRQATYPVWADQTGFYAHAVTYRTQNFAGAISGTNTFPPAPFDEALRYWTTSSIPASGGIAGTIFNGTTSNTYAIMGDDPSLAGASWTYIPKGANYGISLSLGSGGTAGAGGTNVTLDYEMWTAPGQAADVTGPLFTVMAAGNMSVLLLSTNATSNMWIRPKFVSGSTIAGSTVSMSVTIVMSTGAIAFTSSTTTAGIWQINAPVADNYVHVPLVQPVEFANSPLPWYACRTTATGLLCTNVSQVLNKGGTVLAGRVSPAVQSPWLMTRSYIQALHPAEKAYLPLETGFYTYVPPSTDLLYFTDYSLNTTNAAPAAPLFNLGNDSLYNKAYFTATAVAETMAATVSWHIEFRTSSALFQIGLSPLTLEALHTAQLVLAETGFFFENPEHKDMLNKVMRAAGKFAPMVGAFSPAAGAMMAMAGKYATGKVVRPKIGPSKPPTTTARASGIIGPPASRRPRQKNKKKGGRAKKQK